MAILAECDICGNQHRVKDGLVGQSIRCKECGVQFVVPADNLIASETFVEEGGRLRRRETETDASLWPQLLAGLVASFVIAILAGVVWTFFNIVKPAPKPTVNGVSVSSCRNCGRIESANSSTVQER